MAITNPPSLYIPPKFCSFLLVSHKRRINANIASYIHNYNNFLTENTYFIYFLLITCCVGFDDAADACIVKLSESLPQDVSNLSEHMKASFGPSWKEVLCKKELKHSEPGSPALLTISLSALRSLELLR